MKPNILFFLVDSLRADKYFGNNLKSHLSIRDSLINKGIYFEQAFASSDYTETGFMSILTGRYPLNASQSGKSYYKIYQNFPNLINILTKFGYHTYCTMESALSKFGYSSNFENEDPDYDRTSIGLFSGLGEIILKKLESGKFKEPWFYYIHLDDLHIPVKIPPEFQDKKYIERYEIMVTEIDSWIGKILKKIDLDSTLVVLTSDHGDYMVDLNDTIQDNFKQKLKNKVRNKVPSSQYDFLARIKKGFNRQVRIAKAKTPYQKRIIDTRTAKDRFLFDDLVHIPLLFVGKGIPPKGSVQNLVRSVDIFPTICDLIEIPVNKNLDGRSLKPILKNQQIEEIPVYLESTVYDNQQSHRASVGIRTSSYKFFRNLADPTKNIHLYDLKNDPLEENNLSEDKPEIVEEMEKIIEDLRSKNIKEYVARDSSEEETKKVEDELRKLGYI